MPAMIQESWPEPSSPSTLPTMQVGARRDALAARRPTRRRCRRSSTRRGCRGRCGRRPSSPGTKLCVCDDCPARSGWVASTPVSSTATFTPVPSSPAAHAVGAPICGTLSSSIALHPAVEPDLVDAAPAARGRAGPARSSSRTHGWTGLGRPTERRARDAGQCSNRPCCRAGAFGDAGTSTALRVGWRSSAPRRSTASS